MAFKMRGFEAFSRPDSAKDMQYQRDKREIEMRYASQDVDVEAEKEYLQKKIDRKKKGIKRKEDKGVTRGIARKQRKIKNLEKMLENPEASAKRRQMAKEDQELDRLDDRKRMSDLVNRDRPRPSPMGKHKNKY
tara:strand:- start:1478 stop:1879 length:402 start_codon:yes stop_codon:yes gene_type:complete